MTPEDRLYTRVEVVRALEAALAAAGSTRAWCRRHGVTTAAVSLALHGSRPIERAVLRALGFERVVCYRRRLPALQEDAHGHR